MGKLKGKIALVTGGTSGIGKSIVENFVIEGATVLFVGRDEKKAKEILDDIGHNKLIDFYKYDLSDLKNIPSLQKYVAERYGTLDILVNCAGIWHTHTLQQITLEEYELVYRTNTGAIIFLTKSFIDMLEKSKGNIINIASIGGLQSHIIGRSQYLYGSSKAATIQFSQLCALNYAKTVRVNCICPGPTDTPVYINRDFSWVGQQIPMGKMGEPSDAARAAVYLASDEAKYITGAVLTVDGGASLV